MTLFGSNFLLLLVGINICLAYSVYPTAILGRINVAPVAYMAIGAYASAYCTTNQHSIVLGAAAGLAISLVIALLLSLLVGHLRGHFFLAASLGVALIVQQTAFSLKSVTNGYLGMSTPADIVQPWHIAALVGLCIVAAISLRYSAADRIWRAVGDDDQIASALGIDYARVVMIASVCSAVIATASGVLYAHIIAFFDPNSFGLPLILGLVSAVVLGGVSNWYGPILGAFIITILPELLRGFGLWRLAAIGFVLIAAVLFLPRGLSDTNGLRNLGRSLLTLFGFGRGAANPDNQPPSPANLEHGAPALDVREARPE
jgi:branched-chain amino acid transport system permease protein